MKFYCTSGRGTEIFVVEEIRQIFGQDTQIISTEGKTYFTVSNNGLNTMQKLMSLRTVERVFVEVLHDNFSKLDRRGLLTLLHTRLNDKAIWQECISTVKCLSSSGLVSQQNTEPDSTVETSYQCISVASKQQATEYLSPNIDTSNKLIKYEEQKNADCLAKDADTCNPTLKCGVRKARPQVNPEKNNLISETDMIPEIGFDVDVSSVTNAKLHSIDTHKTDTIRTLEGNVDTGVLRTSNKRTKPESDSYVNTPDNDIGDKISENDTNTSVSNSNDKMTVSESKVTKNRSVPSTFSHCIKRRKLERGYTNTFRVSCRFSGYARKQLNVQRTSQQMGVLISKLLGWKIDLKHPKYEINIHLGDGTFTVGIPLTDIPLSKRSYIKHCGLRTPIAYIMANLVDICPGNVILDPMCGCATVLMEASKVCLTAAFIGIDNDITQLRLAAENIEHCDKMNSCMSLIHGDTTHIPLSNNSMDGVITDAPFGQNHVVTENIYTFYGKMLSELTRIVKPRGKIVLLTSSDMVHFVTELCSDTLTNIMSSETVTRVEGDEVPKEVGTFDNENGSQVKDVMEINRQEVSIKYSKNSNIDIDSHFPLFLKAAHNVKLGETEGCILVLQKSARTKLP